ncbi:hypothetical protein BaRGS_00019830 [Batillaria attramentaria]|uniref:Uncharacterized protein n=1 Tax=Batillaria attramentaria TaxID=370345 RepID=A0ABD0KNR4_9CAEN
MCCEERTLAPGFGVSPSAALPVSLLFKSFPKSFSEKRTSRFIATGIPQCIFVGEPATVTTTCFSVQVEVSEIASHPALESSSRHSPSAVPGNTED